MKTRNTPIWLATGLLVTAPTAAIPKPFTTPKTGAGMDTCLEAALAKDDGETAKLEFKTEWGSPVYEIEIAVGAKTSAVESSGSCSTLRPSSNRTPTTIPEGHLLGFDNPVHADILGSGFIYR